ncbi:unnamed protein product [Aphanomyces euteiches]
MTATPQNVRCALKQLAKAMKTMSHTAFYRRVSSIQDAMQKHLPYITTARDMLIDMKNISYMSRIDSEIPAWSVADTINQTITA